MRKIEWVPWTIICMIGLIVGSLMMIVPNPDAYTPITVEITGTMLGFLVALSFAELFKAKDKIDRERDLLNSIVQEVLDFRGVLKVKDSPPVLPNEMWQMGIASGDALLIDIKKRVPFSQYYYLAVDYNEMRKVWVQAICDNRMHDADIQEKGLFRRVDAMKPYVLEIVNKYAPEYVSELLDSPEEVSS